MSAGMRRTLLTSRVPLTQLVGPPYPFVGAPTSSSTTSAYSIVTAGSNADATSAATTKGFVREIIYAAPSAGNGTAYFFTQNWGTGAYRDVSSGVSILAGTNSYSVNLAIAEFDTIGVWWPSHASSNGYYYTTGQSGYTAYYRNLADTPVAGQPGPQTQFNGSTTFLIAGFG